MVDVTAKAATVREATARGVIQMSPRIIEQIQSGSIAKGNVLETARIAGIMAAKKTADIIPMCHPLNLTAVSMEFLPRPELHQIEVRATARIVDKTGVEMEALVAATKAALTIYDMCKAIDRGMVISGVELLRKSGGKSGTYEKTP